MDWIELAQDRDRCFVLVNAVMNYGVYGLLTGKFAALIDPQHLDKLTLITWHYTGTHS
jgi:hypothetical protein